MSEDVEDLGYAKRVGGRLRTVRRQKGLSLQEVEAGSNQEFKASVLGAYERGERAISVPRLYRLARFYGVPADRLLPAEPEEAAAGTTRTEISLIDEEGSPTTGPSEESLTIDLTRLHDLPEPDGEMLSRYLSMIQLQRQDFNGRVLTVRRDDLRAIACMFDTTPSALRRRFDDQGLRVTT